MGDTRKTDRGTMKFYELALGALFTWHGKTYTKAAMGCAADENRLGYAFFRVLSKYNLKGHC
jgi:hypothetical protein